LWEIEGSRPGITGRSRTFLVNPPMLFMNRCLIRST